MIRLLTEWVLDQALVQCGACQRQGIILPVSVNLSVWNLHDPWLGQMVAQLLQRHGIPPTWLRFELTESAMMTDTDRTLTVLDQFVGLGVRISMDDYGTGYSSLSYIKRLPIDQLKIDRSFVQHMVEDDADAAIVRSTVALGHTLGLRVVAEGVERQKAWEQLVAMGCDAVQGYYVNRPLPADQLKQWLRNTTWATA